jgi:hypothetical protein
MRIPKQKRKIASHGRLAKWENLYSVRCLNINLFIVYTKMYIKYTGI